MKKIISLLVLVLLVSMLAVTAFAEEVQVPETITYGYAYDCQRDPAYPNPNGGTTIFSSFDEPSLTRSEDYSTSTGPWTLTLVTKWGNTSEDATVLAAKEAVKGTITSMQTQYPTANLSNIGIYKLTHGAASETVTEIGYIALVAQYDNGAFGELIGDLGWYFTNDVPTSSVTGTLTHVFGNEVDENAEYTVKFDLQGGIGVAGDSETENNELPTMPADPTKEGYTFNGWYTAPVGGVKIEDNTKFYTDTTLYAQWTAVEPEEDPKPEVKPEPCDHKFDENGKCSRCGIVVISYENGKPAVEAETEANPNTGAESAIGAFAAIAVISLAGIAVSKRK